MQCSPINVIGPANLGHCPQEMIAADFANRFGGLSDDFHVARYRERDYAIFLPQWVRLDELVHREVIRFPHCQLRFYEWNPYRNAPRSQLTYKVWIRLVNLPFECWTEYKVADIVNSFERFLRADKSSINMLDLIAFRCQIAIDDPADIPESLAITMGDFTVVVLVVMERTAPLGGDDRGIPFAGGDPNEGEDQTDPLGRSISHRNALGADVDALLPTITEGKTAGRFPAVTIVNRPNLESHTDRVSSVPTQRADGDFGSRTRAGNGNFSNGTSISRCPRKDGKGKEVVAVSGK